MMRNSTKFLRIVLHGSCVLVAVSQILAVSSTPATAGTVNSGTAWMLEDATVFYDLDNDGRYDKGEEPSTTTDNKGFYQLKGPKEAVPLTLLGGHHSIFGKTFEGVLSTPKYADQLNQSTTILHFLVEELIRDPVMPVETKDEYLKIRDEANAILTRALGIDPSIDLATFDPKEDVHVYSVNAALHSVMNDVAIALKAAYGEAALNTEAIYHATAKVLAKQIAANRDQKSDYLNFEKGVSAAFFRDVTREVGPEVIAVQEGDDFSHDFDDIAYIAAPDISRRAQMAARLVHKQYLEDPAQLYKTWSAFHDESVRIIKDDVHQGLGLYWSYAMDHRKGWAAINKKYIMCGTGRYQSPIDIDTQQVLSAKELEEQKGSAPVRVSFHYEKEQGLHMLNNGHTLQVNPKADNYILVNDERFNLIQFHFHEPSEERIDGKQYGMQAQFVHANRQRDFAVVSVLLEPDSEKDHPVIKILFDNARALTPEEEKKHTTAFFNIEGGWFMDRVLRGLGQKDKTVAYDLSELLPKSKKYFHYIGSLTTPPCTEGVRYFVLREPVSISQSQVKQYKEGLNLHDTARRVQSLNRRVIYTYDNK